MPASRPDLYRRSSFLWLGCVSEDVSTATDGGSVPLTRIIQTVEGHGQTLTLYNTDVLSSTLEAIQRYFTTTSVKVQRGSTDDGLPRNFAILRDDDEFIAAADVRDLQAATDPTAGWLDTDEPRKAYPELLNKIDQSVFTDYGKRRMILASRDIEQQAWDTRPSTVHVGFQEFGRLRSQLPLYWKLAASVDIHLYGVPDWQPPIEQLSLHGYETDEIRSHWFVVIEPDDTSSCS